MAGKNGNGDSPKPTKRDVALAFAIASQLKPAFDALGNKMDELGDKMDELGAKMDAGFESLGKTLGANMDAGFESLGNRLGAKMDAGFESLGKTLGTKIDNNTLALLGRIASIPGIPRPPESGG